MTCTDVRPLLHAHADGELDLLHSVEVERHIKSCAACSRAENALRSLRSAVKASGLTYRAPDSLRDEVRRTVFGTTKLPATDRASNSPSPREAGWDAAFGAPSPRGEGRGEGDRDVLQPVQPHGNEARRQKVHGEGGRTTGVSWLLRWLAFGGTSIAAVLLVLLLNSGSAGERVANEVVTAHVHSLMAEHLTDVASSDQHTVKPWFSGKLDFAPNVRDFTAQGFPLVGGRLDLIDGRPVAALVYRRNKHVINVFIWPVGSVRAIKVNDKNLRGYSMINKESNGLHYCPISDLNSGELNELASLLTDRGRPQSL